MRRSVSIELVLLSALIAASLPSRASFAAGAKPYFLVATPQMGDPIFGGSVIMMIPTIDAPLLAGVIVNKPTTTSPQEVFPHFPAIKNGPNSAYFGGPVDNGQAIVAFRAPHPPAKALHVFDDVYVSADADTIAQIIKDNTDPANLRIFLGRAQWLNEQLHTEIMEGAWYVVPADAAQVFDADPTHLWRKLVERGELQEVRFLLPLGHLDTF
ncbi:MAG TPA: YqgE/AlgH family protein [Sporolactobacillaceae bacterium]|nr:YqgE/AlgH family protein [Sporolactobacillaceae bacterium]